ncbi:3-deoxy-manno-octulosonate cytidylyltransferase [Fulvivirga sp.]|uniref:3-deoxy-manno-octulosonate cytidylyltransferase n=1 Tax=Fulvivirga sp. TaxID=1931237 RepID=UPI0032EB0907
MKILGIIPARYASTRFPAKALTDIGGKPMIQRVYEQASKSSLLSKVVIATDHNAIAEAVSGFKGNYCMTSPDHQSGTDRCQEVVEKETESFDYVINIQGDEPFIDPSQIDLLAGLLDGETELGTLVKKIDHINDVFDSNVVKCVFNAHSEAMYFSRSAIPHLRNHPKEEWLKHHDFFKHIGIYGYRIDVLNSITKLPVSGFEKAESLEQLRWLENGYKIKVAITDIQSYGVDTPADLEKLKGFY